MAKKTFKKVEGFPGYQVSKDGIILEGKTPLIKFGNGKCVNLKRDNAIHVKIVSDLVDSAFKVNPKPVEDDSEK